MAKTPQKTKEFMQKHKFITGIAVLILLGAAYWGYSVITAKKPQTSYVTSAAAIGTLTTSVSGSGQVSANNSVNLQFQGSGTLTYLGVQNGQTVSAGQLIAELDTTNAEESVRDAQASLDAEQINLQKLQGSGNPTTPENEQAAENTLSQDYQTSYNTVSNSFLDLPNFMTDLKSILYSNTYGTYEENIDFYESNAAIYNPKASQLRDTVNASYQTALSDYNQNFTDYKSATRTSDTATLDSLIAETTKTSTDIDQALKDASNLIQFYKDTLTSYNIKTDPGADTALTTLTTDQDKADTDVSNLLNSQTTLSNDKLAVSGAGLDLQAEQLNVQEKQNALSDAKAALSDYYIYAPFSGTIGNVSVQNLTQVGSGTVIATLITSKKIATIPLNEVDVSNVTVGQPAVITFDALPDLSVAGTVASINPIGTVSQGVVTYNVEIGFDTQDPRVKSGMSMTANVITNVKQNVLLVPNAAVKTQGTTKYVQVLANNVPQMKIVQVGLSNTTSTEITSGLNAGDKVITQTISSSTSTAPATTGTGTRVGGFGGGGAIRIGGFGG